MLAQGYAVRFKDSTMRWKAHRRNITSLALSPDLSSVLSADIDGNVCQWNIETGELLTVIRKPTRSGRGGKIAYDPSGSRLGVSWNYSLSEGQLEVYAVENWSLEYEVHFKEVFDFAWSPDGRQIAVASEAIWLIDAANGEIVPTPSMGHYSWTQCVSFTPDGKKIVSGGDIYDPSFALWDTVTFENLAKIDTDETYSPSDVLHILNNEAIINDTDRVIK